MGTLSNWLAPSNNDRMKAARLPHPVAARQDPLVCWLRTLGDGSLERSAVRREVVVVEKRAGWRRWCYRRAVSVNVVGDWFRTVPARDAACRTFDVG